MKCSDTDENEKDDAPNPLDEDDVLLLKTYGASGGIYASRIATLEKDIEEHKQRIRDLVGIRRPDPEQQHDSRFYNRHSRRDPHSGHDRGASRHGLVTHFHHHLALDMDGGDTGRNGARSDHPGDAPEAIAPPRDSRVGATAGGDHAGRSRLAPREGDRTG